MDVCSWDWGAISTIIGAGIASATALYISRQWRNQKGSEVIANEANKAFKVLSEIEILSFSALKHFKDDNYKHLVSTYTEYQDKYEILRDSILLILYVVSDSSLKDKYSNFDNTYENFSKVISNKLEYDSFNDSNIDELTRNIDDIVFTKHSYSNEIKIILSEYALFKRISKSA